MQWNKEAGRKPSKKLLQEASNYVRPNTQDQMVIAMAMRSTGMTQHEIISLFGYPHRNVIKKVLLKDRRFKKVELPEWTRFRRIKLIKSN